MSIQFLEKMSLSKQNEKLGSMQDILRDTGSGTIFHAVVSLSGFMGMADK
jgi:hypothetical protein